MPLAEAESMTPGELKYCEYFSFPKSCTMTHLMASDPSTKTR